MLMVLKYALVVTVVNVRLLPQQFYVEFTKACFIKRK